MSVRTATSLPYTELPVANGNYDTSRKPITKIILHTMVGTTKSAAARFNTAGAQASAHYGISLDGSITHWLEEYLTAYHCGNYAVNQESIGIEHEDKGDYNGPRTPQLYQTSAKLVADICRFYSIPCDRVHIRGHREVALPTNPTACPDSLDLDRIVNSANLILNPPATIPEWQLNLVKLPALLVKRLETLSTLRNMDTDAVIKTLLAGEVLAVAYSAKVKGQDFYMTEYSVKNNLPNGFLKSEVDFFAPIPPEAIPPQAPVVPVVTPEAPEPTPTPTPDPAAVLPQDAPVGCSECGITLASKQSFWDHYFSTHADKGVIDMFDKVTAFFTKDNAKKYGKLALLAAAALTLVGNVLLGNTDPASGLRAIAALFGISF